MTQGTVEDPSRYLEDLFTEFHAGSLRVRNRFAMAPMTRAKSPGGVPNAENIDYYRSHAAGGAGLIITEGTYVRGPAAGPHPDVPRFYGEDSAAGWRAVVEAVHGEGGAIVPQLWHTGVERGRTPDLEPEVSSVSPSGIEYTGQQVGRAATADDLDALVESYVESAILAERLGFDGIELHGAHGYLLDQFFWTATNRRGDEYGGTLRERAAFPARVVAAVRAAVASDFPIIYRYSQWKGVDYTARIAETPGELEELLTPLVEAGVDIFHTSLRRHWLPEFTDHADDLSLAGWTKKITGLPVITVGSVGVDSVFRGDRIDETQADRFRVLQRQFERGEFDIVAVGRALLADPAWVNKVRDGRLPEITPFR
ncbi:2,4-dienoyl-CoA reductase-like NADH-dependent reductase (Old Yellow Enzyme family) [Nocardia transvalensis]|uniref:2,4-dienoyl-CoA reductase-like NADH-dependent reductase (Old Yellow Enzyme family) n=1 Tax=Nocardia transvalensis TaxID=37333 RepID=A0A7W9PHD4_9NOCA|nr:NADH:flavin oxidoreductase [Nocardia transvalensis]MBB5916115.1 2,4-dienoyl-CoA reductase-like NADH-dependent reductase (Old Yellow Enzyme family) [Nocardia transvalensis]